MMVLEKRLSPSAKISYTVSCNISLYRDTKEVIYPYTQTQNVCRCISIVYSAFDCTISTGNKWPLMLIIATVYIHIVCGYSTP